MKALACCRKCLDEKALDAVKQYKFRPAFQHGKPVKVDTYVEVLFQIF